MEQYSIHVPVTTNQVWHFRVAWFEAKLWLPGVFYVGLLGVAGMMRTLPVMTGTMSLGCDHCGQSKLNHNWECLWFFGMGNNYGCKTHKSWDITLTWYNPYIFVIIWVHIHLQLEHWKTQAKTVASSQLLNSRCTRKPLFSSLWIPKLLQCPQPNQLPFPSTVFTPFTARSA